MAKIETIRPDLGVSQGMAESNPAVAAFRAGRGAEDRVVDLLAFAMAAERGEEATPEAVERLRQEAGTALSDFAFRYLHNTIDQVRRDAVAEHLGQFRQPPGFPRLVLANLVALAVAGLAAWWLAQHPALLAGLSGLLAG